MTRKRIWQISILLCMCSVVARIDVVSWSGEHETVHNSNEKAAMFRLDTMCGPNCIWQIARAYGKDYPLKDIAQFAGTNAIRGTTVKGLVEACRKIGLPAKAVKTNVEVLARDPRVAILLLDVNDLMHYVILDHIGNSEVRLLDATEFREISIHELESIWTGVTILIGDNEDRRTDRLQRYFGTGLQISGVLILLVVATYGVISTYLYLSKRQ